MNPVVIFLGMVASLMGGYYLGFDWGKKQTLTKRAAASVLAKASHKNRKQKVITGGFLRFMR